MCQGCVRGVSGVLEFIVPHVYVCVYVQMCFLKGRVTDKHTANHQMMEFSSVGKGQKSWHHRLVGSKGRSQGGRVFEESKSPFVYSPRTSVAR